VISLKISTLSTTTRTWHDFLGTESHPVFCVAMFPLVSLLPSIPLRRQLFSVFVRELRRYYETVRIPVTVHHRRASLDFTVRTTAAFAASANHGTSRFSRRLYTATRSRSLTPPGIDGSRHVVPSIAAQPGLLTRGHPDLLFRGSILGLPATSVNACTRTLRGAHHDSRTA